MWFVVFGLLIVDMCCLLCVVCYLRSVECSLLCAVYDNLLCVIRCMLIVVCGS